MTEVKAEVPMAEMLSYAPDLRSMTGGQGEYTLEFLRYEEVPAHLAQKVVAEGPEQEEAAGVAPRCYPRRAVARTRDIRTNQQRRLLRRLRAHAAARRAGRAVPRRRLAPPGVRALHRARAARGLDPRGRRDELTLRARGTRAARGFVERLRARRERAREVAAEAAAAQAAMPEGRESHSTGRTVHPPEASGAWLTAAPPAPRPRGAHQRRAQDGARARGVQRLRATSHGRRRRPLARRARRSPRARWPTARASSAITVMWELSWYRFEVDLSDEGSGVRQDGQGAELGELDATNRSSTRPPTSAAACISRAERPNA